MTGSPDSSTRSPQKTTAGAWRHDDQVVVGVPTSGIRDRRCPVAEVDLIVTDRVLVRSTPSPSRSQAKFTAQL